MLYEIVMVLCKKRMLSGLKIDKDVMILCTKRKLSCPILCESVMFLLAKNGCHVI